MSIGGSLTVDTGRQCKAEYKLVYQWPTCPPPLFNDTR